MKKIKEFFKKLKEKLDIKISAWKDFWKHITFQKVLDSTKTMMTKNIQVPVYLIFLVAIGAYILTAIIGKWLTLTLLIIATITIIMLRYNKFQTRDIPNDEPKDGPKDDSEINPES